MKEWFKNSMLGKKLYELWRMLFNDDTGVSMRKIIAVKLSFVMDYVVIRYTTEENLYESLWALGGMITALLGIVTYANIKSNEQKRITGDTGGNVNK